MKTVHFNKSGKLRILQLTDLHWENGSRKDLATLSLVKRLLAEEKPDLVALTGDTVYGEKNKEQLARILEPIAECGAPFAYVFGNHDTEWGASKEELFEIISAYPNSLMEKGTVSGVGNYAVRVEDQTGRSPWVLYFLDSQQYNPNPEIGGYGYIFRDQIDWYQQVNRALKEKEEDFSALAFFHIALPEYNEVWEREVCRGHKWEEVCCPRQNTGMFSAMLEEGNMKGVFVGHDHVNDYMGSLYGVKLCFGRGTGYNTYGRGGFAHGARVIEISSRDTSDFVTWLHLDDGSIDTIQPKHEPALPRE